MKIAILAPLRYPIKEPYAGGLEAHTHQLAIGLRALGHTVTLFAHPDSDASFDLAPFQVAESGAVLPAAFVYRKALKRIAAGDFDVVQNNSIHFLPPLMAHSLPAPMVTTLHTPPYRSHLATAWLAAGAAKHTYVAISHYILSVWARFVNQATVIHNGVDLARFTASRQSTGLDDSQPAAAPKLAKTAIWYGRIVPIKGLHFAIQTAVEAGFKLTVAGVIEDQRYFEEKIEPLLNNHVVYVGHKNQEALSALIARASVGLVTPVWQEPFGLVCVEMLACGTPVAAFEGGAIREIVTEDCGRVVEWGHTGALARVLSEVARLPPAACRARAEEFSLNKMVTQYASLYMQLPRK